MRTHFDHRTLAEMGEMARLDRLNRILEAASPPFDFYTHEHPEEIGRRLHVRN